MDPEEYNPENKFSFSFFGKEDEALCSVGLESKSMMKVVLGENLGKTQIEGVGTLEVVQVNSSEESSSKIFLYSAILVSGIAGFGFGYWYSR